MALSSCLFSAMLLAVLVAMTSSNPVVSRWSSLTASESEAETIEARLLFQPQQQSGDDVSRLEQSWTDFKQTYGKQYESDEEEKGRMEVFHSNLDFIDKHNAEYARGHKSFTTGVNQFADMELHEFVSMMNGFKALNNSARTHGGATYLSPANDFTTLTLADSVDWRTKGYVTPVKDQGQCGSCWAFSATGSMEGQHFRSSGQLVSLSEQNLVDVDCSGKYGNMGCNGGLMDYAFQYVIDNGGIDTEESYPYEETDSGPCRFSKANVGATFTSYVDVPQEDENALKEAVATVGPVSVAIDASHQSFQLYKSGLYDEPDCSSQQLDHGVLAVGYGTTAGQDSWIVKNSWNTNWGDQGYIYMSRNKNNQCGIATMASYPVV